MTKVVYYIDFEIIFCKTNWIIFFLLRHMVFLSWTVIISCNGLLPNLVWWIIWARDGNLNIELSIPAWANADL